MPIPATWIVQEYDKGEQIDTATVYYKVQAVALVYYDEGLLLKDYWDNTLTNTSAGTMTLTAVAFTTASAVGESWYIASIVAYDTDPEDCHEDVVDDIKTMQDALVARATQVSGANDSGGEIATYASGKITAVLGRP